MSAKVMPDYPSILWLSLSPSLRPIDSSLLHLLSQSRSVRRWEYQQGADEPCCLKTAIVLLHDYLKHCPHSVHLAGHSTAGLVGLLYARQYPKRVRSLSMLSVGNRPAIDWHALYYSRLLSKECCRSSALTQLVGELFGKQLPSTQSVLIELLARDLSWRPSPHSLWRTASVEPGGCSVPLFVGGAIDDVVIGADALRNWKQWLKPGDRLCEWPKGRHFFHHLYPQAVRTALLDFWDSVEGQLNQKQKQLALKVR